ncbi:zinc finger protein 704 [Bufo gargarizans]|uniref:zinc finger protein 704 n=1 Tax=Bufo gargarizans TaxID=30331 RepID=UPI001CF5637E|nr:zinc finger protein 704 [Bufo gargarizans]
MTNGHMTQGDPVSSATSVWLRHGNVKPDVYIEAAQWSIVPGGEGGGSQCREADWKKTSSMALRNAARAVDSEQELRQEGTRSICLLEQKRKVVSSNIDVPQARKYEVELDMDKVTAAMVLTSLSTSPLVRSPPIRLTDVNECWKDAGYVPSSSSSSGYWSWNTTSDYSNPSTPSPPLSADHFKNFRCTVHPEDNPDETDSGNLFFEDPVPRKRKNSMKVMFKCLWKKCGKILSTAAGIKKHIRNIHLGRTGESDDCDGEEDFYYTEIRLNNDTEGLCSLSSVSPSFASPPSTVLFPSNGSCEYRKTETKLNGRLSRSAPNTFYLVQSDHAYQRGEGSSAGLAGTRVSGEGSSVGLEETGVSGEGSSVGLEETGVSGEGSSVGLEETGVSGEGRSVGLEETGVSGEGSSVGLEETGVSGEGSSVGLEKTGVSGEGSSVGLEETGVSGEGSSVGLEETGVSGEGSSVGLEETGVSGRGARSWTWNTLDRKPRGEGKKCRKVYGMENRDKWCTACRWKKACQRFPD